MNSSTKFLMAAVGCAALAFPAGASAGMPDVKQYLSKADQYLAKAEQLVENGRDAGAAKGMDRANTETEKAFSEAVRMVGIYATRAERRVATQYDDHVDAFVDSIVEMRTPSQVDVAVEIQEAVDGRKQAVTELTELLDQLPEQAAQGLTRAIAAIQGDNAEELEALATAVANGEIGAGALSHVEDALVAIEQGLATAIAQLEALVAQLPHEAQPYVQDAIDRLKTQLADVLDIVGDVIPDLPVYIPPLVPSGQLPIPFSS